MRFFMSLTLSIFLGGSVGHTATLEIPGSGSTQSGIGVISGWKCDANGQLTVRFNRGPSLPLIYGSERGDTRSVCGDSENGFVAIWNWGVLGDGRHTAVVYDNGIEFDRATFTVVTPGVDFLQGVSGSGTATLSNGQRVTLQWSEGSQSFVATDFTVPEDGGVPETSGLGQFLGTWRFTNSHTTQTYQFPHVEPCRGDASEQCLYDDTQVAVLTVAEVQGYSYGLLHIDGNVCRGAFLYEPGGNTVQGHYGFGVGSCDEDSVVRSIAEDIVARRYPTTGTRIRQATSQAFSLEAEEEAAVTREETEEMEAVIEELLDLMRD